MGACGKKLCCFYRDSRARQKRCRLITVRTKPWFKLQTMVRTMATGESSKHSFSAAGPPKCTARTSRGTNSEVQPSRHCHSQAEAPAAAASYSSDRKPLAATLTSLFLPGLGNAAAVFPRLASVLSGPGRFALSLAWQSSPRGRRSLRSAGATAWRQAAFSATPVAGAERRASMPSSQLSLNRNTQTSQLTKGRLKRQACKAHPNVPGRKDLCTLAKAAQLDMIF